jgi:hypothetical protein
MAGFCADGMGPSGIGTCASVGRSPFSVRASVERVGTAKSKASDVTARRRGNRMMAPGGGDVRGECADMRLVWFAREYSSRLRRDAGSGRCLPL